MNQALETLFYPLTKGLAEAPEGRVLFLNAQSCEGIELLDLPVCQQYFKPHADAAGAQAEIPEDVFEAVFLHAPKNRIEAQYLLARGIAVLKEGRFVFCAAANDAGGSRLEKMLEEAGFENIHSASKNKARVVWAQKEKINDAPLAWLKTGGVQQIGGFYTQAGIFGWDKIDVGSQILTQHLPTLSGHGADFGCGYGYLSHFVLKNSSDVKSILCIDADKRAVEMCEKNIESFTVQKEFIWADLTQSQKNIRNLDFIVMNPPFHEGKSMDTDIGKAFIETASASLHKGGHLWMVANSRLPYEEVLQKSFFKVEKKFQGGGFKVFNAVK